MIKIMMKTIIIINTITPLKINIIHIHIMWQRLQQKRQRQLTNSSVIIIRGNHNNIKTNH